MAVSDSITQPTVLPHKSAGTKLCSISREQNHGYIIISWVSNTIYYQFITNNTLCNTITSQTYIFCFQMKTTKQWWLFRVTIQQPVFVSVLSWIFTFLRWILTIWFFHYSLQHNMAACCSVWIRSFCVYAHYSRCLNVCAWVWMNVYVSAVFSNVIYLLWFRCLAKAAFSHFK